MDRAFDIFDKIWTLDFEFGGGDGNRPVPVCMVAHELRTKERVRVFGDEMRSVVPPLRLGPNDCMVAYYASAELGCFKALGWPAPHNVIDLFVEFRAATNGQTLPEGASLLAAARHYGLPTIAADEKEAMRALALRGGDYTDDERRALLDYCESDVDQLDKLLSKMAPTLDTPRALLRGQYMQAAAEIEWCGIPIDTELHREMQRRWPEVRKYLIETVTGAYDIYEGGSFREAKFKSWLDQRNISWPTLESGRLALDDGTFRMMAERYPEVARIRELREALAEARIADIPIGSDGRHRTMLSAFRAKTGRNQPKNFIFSAPAWVRRLIKPEPGTGISYLDFGQQEFGVAAALSQDPAMLEAYRSGDPYLSFAGQAGALTESTPPEERERIRSQFKRCALAVLYGMGIDGLAASLGVTRGRANWLLELHRQTFPRYHEWSDGMVASAMFHNKMRTVFGWPMQLSARGGLLDRHAYDSEVRIPMVRNFPMQAHGAEILRLACIFATERGVKVCAPVHDALLIEASLDQLDGAIENARRAMEDASRAVLKVLTLRVDTGTESDPKTFRYPDRFADKKRGEELWNQVLAFLRSTPESQP